MYKRNIFTTNETGLAGIPHLGDKDFKPLIDRALALPGFDERSAARAASTAAAKTYTVGFGHHAVLGVASQVIDAVQTGKLSHIFLVGGCDGHEPQRSYYSGLGKELPKDTMLLTLVSTCRQTGGQALCAGRGPLSTIHLLAVLPAGLRQVQDQRPGLRRPARHQPAAAA